MPNSEILRKNYKNPFYRTGFFCFVLRIILIRLTVKIEKIFAAVIGTAGRKTQPEQS